MGAPVVEVIAQQAGFLQRASSAVGSPVGLRDPTGPTPPLIPDWVAPCFYVFQFIICLVVYFTRIKPAADAGKWARKEAIVPAELKGKWASDLCSCFEDMTTCLLTFLGGGMCVVADTCFKAGWPQIVLSSENPVLLYFLTVSIYVCCPLCSQCGALPWLRGGCGDGPCGTVSMGERFEIETSFCLSLLTWCFCPSCAACQENRQITKLVEHPGTSLNPGALLPQGQLVMPGQQIMPGQQVMPSQQTVPGQ